jgi:hypothetical protein
MSRFFPSSLLEAAPRFERQLRRVCENIIAGAQSGRATSPAAEWLLDNYSYLRGQTREIREGMPRGYYRRLPRDGKGTSPRVFAAAQQAVNERLGGLDYNALAEFFGRWQERSVLSLAELWAIRPMLKIALIGRLAASIEATPLESPECETTVRDVIAAFHKLEDLVWSDLVEELSAIDRVFRGDPRQQFDAMDFETRDWYRRAIEELGRHSAREEREIAGLALRLAHEANRHVGYYVVGGGVAQLRQAARVRRSVSMLVRDIVLAIPSAVYLSGAAVLTAGVLTAVRAATGALPWWYYGLLLIPASQAALAIANLLVGNFLKPRALPRMDFQNGIPDEFRTVVVVPSLLLSAETVERLVGNLEISYLANRDRNLFFALLTDLPDSDESQGGEDLVEQCAQGIRTLNRRYRDADAAPFFLFHRSREWNASECRWIGRERKRGKLDDFNQFLLGRGDRFSVTIGKTEQLAGTRYVITLDSDTQLPRETAVKLAGNMAHPLNRPVFEEATGLVCEGYGLLQPRIGISIESASKTHLASIYSGQVGFDPYTKAVSDVYQDLFGRATFTGKGIYDVAAFDRATRGRFPDNTLLSHDLIEGEHVRAGLVTDIEMIDDYPSRYQTFAKRKHRWVRGDWQIFLWLLPRVPDAQWKWVPNPLPLVSRWKIFDNLRRSLTEIFTFAALVCAWFALGEASLAATLAIVGLLLVPVYVEILLAFLRPTPVRLIRPLAWTRFSAFLRGHLDAVLSLEFVPVQALLTFDAIVRTLYRRLCSQRHLLEWESMAQAEMPAGERFHAGMLFSPGDLVRRFRSWNMVDRASAAAVAGVLAIWTGLVAISTESHAAAFAITLGWLSAPVVAIWLNSALKAGGGLEDDGPAVEFLHGVALATWRYFTDHESAETNWLVPDNVQEDPPLPAHRTSPTNIGLQLNATLAAHAFGYLTHEELALRLGRIENTARRLERYRGHLYNWYDTRTLEVLPPRFVSTVDSGNLAASLIVTRQGCWAVLNQPLIGRKILEGLRDHLQRLREAMPVSTRSTSIVRVMEALRRQFDAQPDDLFFFEGVLTEVGKLLDELRERVERAARRLEIHAPAPAAEIRYWLSAFTGRIDAAVRQICELAPWLCQPFETELRISLGNPALADLMGHLRRIPKLNELEETYGAIECEIGKLDERTHPSTRRVLEDLLPALSGAREAARGLGAQFQDAASVAGAMTGEMEFRFLLDERRRLFRIGWNADANELEPSSYDLLASEARTAVFLAIARGDAPRETWFRLGRKLTSYRGHRTLISWSGTMFEYLMPALFMRNWPGTLLGESLRSVVRIQRLYARERRIPWGISESAHAGRDVALNYQYRAFGVPCCGVARILPDDLVVAPYATVLALMVDERAALENLRHMASRGWLARYGFYDAIDFRRRLHGLRRTEVVRTFMAHHQGMSLLALASVLLGNPIQNLFHADPAVMATELLLHERLPAMAEEEPREAPLPGIENVVKEPLPGMDNVVTEQGASFETAGTLS